MYAQYQGVIIVWHKHGQIISREIYVANEYREQKYYNKPMFATFADCFISWDLSRCSVGVLQKGNQESLARKCVPMWVP